MNRILYPSRESLKLWVKILKSENSSLDLSLPVIDDDWYKKVLEILDLVQMSYYEDGLHKKAALIFYKIVKAL